MRYVIIGAGVAGVSALKEIVKERKTEDTITLITEESYPFYYRPRLIECLSGEVDVEDIIINDEEWFEKNDIDFKMSEKAKDIDVKNKELITDKSTYIYDKLLLANGAHSFVPPIKGHEKENVFTLRNASDAKEIYNRCKNLKNVVVVGGGLLGLESAYNFNKAGLNVVVLERSSSLLSRQLDKKAGQLLQKILEEKGLNFYLEAETKEFLGNDKVEAVLPGEGKEIKADLVLLSTGVRSNLDLISETSIKVERAIAVNNKLETNIEGIYAAGDVSELDGRFYGIWPPAMEQGKTAGRNMTGKNEEFKGFVPSHKLKVAGIQVVSKGELDFEGNYKHQLKESDSAYRNITINEDDELIGAIIVGEFPDNEEILAKIKN